MSPRGLALALAAAATLGGCASTAPPPRARTSFLRSVDLVEMTDRMAQSLAGDDVVGRRTAEDEPWVVSIERITNRTNQVIRSGERWLYVARLRGLLAQTDFASQRSIVWVMPPERWAAVVDELPAEQAAEPLELRTPPTHQLTGEFLALTTTGAAGRTDTTVCSYQLIDLATGTLVWEDQWEVKRFAPGVTWD